LSPYLNWNLRRCHELRPARSALPRERVRSLTLTGLSTCCLLHTNQYPAWIRHGPAPSGLKTTQRALVAKDRGSPTRLCLARLVRLAGCPPVTGV